MTNQQEIASLTCLDSKFKNAGIQENSTELHDEIQEDTKNFGSKKVYRSWLLLCFSTGPVAAMSRVYVSASIQSMAHSLGKTKMGGPCKSRGSDCYVKFGKGHVNYTSYVVYLKAIYTALEGVMAIFLMGIADYANFKKIILISTIIIYGIFALPFAGLTKPSYHNLTTMSGLYAAMNVLDMAYQIIEAAYIPLIMKGALQNEASIDSNEDHIVVNENSDSGESNTDSLEGDEEYNELLKKGTTISVMGMFLSNWGALTALLIGVIISYGRKTTLSDGYYNYLLAITIAGCVTIVMAIFSSFFIPSTQAKPYPKGEFMPFLSVKRFWSLLKSIRNYPMAFLICISWVLWNVSYSNFMSLYLLLFRSSLGIGSSDAEYTVYTFMTYICSMCGSILWMLLFKKFRMNIKYYGYVFFFISIFTNFWGCLGISKHTKVGFKHRWEFWLFEVFYSATSSSLRCLLRCVYATLLPEGDEAQYFGLEVMLGVATGWIGTLVNATIQDKTGNYNYPFLPNLFLALISCILFWKADFKRGSKESRKLID